MLLLLLAFLESFLGKLAIDIPYGAADPGKVGTNPVNAKLHPALGTLYLRLSGLRL
jgi:hypothetical protein